MRCERWLEPAVERLDSIVAEGIFAVGAQLWVSHRGEVACDIALGDGVGAAMVPATAHNHYCAGKPFVALAIANLVADGTLDPTAPLDALGVPASIRPPFPCTVLDVLDHQVGLDNMAGNEFRLVPHERRAQVLADRFDRATRRPAYSEILGGLILESVLEAASPGESAASVVRHLVLDPLGLDGVAFDPEGAARLVEAGSMSVPIGGLPDRWVPVLHELVVGLEDLRPAFGVVCAVRDLGRLLEACRRALDPDGVDPIVTPAVLAMLLTPRHTPFEDTYAQRTVHLAGGFMVDAVANGMTRLGSSNSFGHHAGFAQTVAFADVDHELTVALYLNGAETGPPQVRLDRLATIDEVYRCLVPR